MQLKWGKNLVFRDSLMFLTNSLESLVQSLRKTDETKFKHFEFLIGSKYPNADFKLLLCKGVFFYEYINLFEKFNEPGFASLRGLRCEKRSAQSMTSITRNAYRRHSDATLLKTISSSTWRVTCANLQTFSKTFASIAFKTSSSTQHTLSRHPSSRGTP